VKDAGLANESSLRVDAWEAKGEKLLDCTVLFTLQGRCANQEPARKGFGNLGKRRNLPLEYLKFDSRHEEGGREKLLRCIKLALKKKTTKRKGDREGTGPETTISRQKITQDR